jgi:hypothetical protein
MLPTPENVQEVRVRAGLTQCQAASMVGLAHAVRWSEIERGKQAMDPARWELFLIKCGRHALYGPRKGVAVPTLENSNGVEPLALVPRYEREIRRKLKQMKKEDQS